MKYPSWSYKPNIRKRQVVLTSRGWVVSETGELLVSNVMLPKSIQRYFDLISPPTIDNDSVNINYEGTIIELDFEDLQKFIDNPEDFMEAELIVLSNNRIAILGDSITNQCSTTTNGTENYGYISNALRRAKQRFVFKLTDNYGVGGDTTAMIKVRVPNVIASGVGTCVIMGGTNDRGTAAMTAEQTINNLRDMRNELNAAGIFVVIMTPMPRGDSLFPEKFLTGTQLAYHLEVRDRILSELPSNNCKVVDNWPLLLDEATGAAKGIKQGYTHDGLHPRTVGAYYVGYQLGDVLNTMTPAEIVMPVADNVYVAVTNVTGDASVNPLFLGTAGVPGTGGSGVLADGWGGTNATGTTGVTRTYSKVGSWQQIVIGGIAATSAAALDLLRQISLHTKCVPGATYEAVCEYELDAGATNVLSLQLGATVTAVSGAIALWDGDRYDNASPLQPVATTGFIRSPRFVMPADATDVRLRLSSYLSTSGAPSATIRVRKMTLRQVL
jgi:lysophospholipase L1-like esterase